MLQKLISLIFIKTLLLVPSLAIAELIEADFISAGDSLLTYDTDTNLEWLDITYFQGSSRSVVEIYHSGFLSTYGFRYANQSEISTLFSNAGIQEIADDIEWTSVNYDGVQYLQSLIGVTHDTGVGELPFGPLSSGIADFDVPVTFRNPVVSLQLYTVDPSWPVARATLEEDVVSSSLAMSWVGHYLVRDAQTVTTPIRIGGSMPVYYSSLQAAYDDANNGDVIQCNATILHEDLYIDLNKTVSIIGGYDIEYLNIGDKTRLNGKIIISNGSVTIENFDVGILND